MTSQHLLGESKKLSSDSMDGLIIGANLENDEINFIVPALSLENAAHEAALADGLIESSGRGPLRSKKMGLRRGKWTTEEENYANKLISEFKMGTLPLTDGTTLRTFLSKLLNCDPMRISKKFVGAKCIGKQVFRRRSADVDKLPPEQIESNHQELAELERLFLDKVSQSTNKGKGGHNDDEDEVGGGGGIGQGGVDDAAWPSHSGRDRGRSLGGSSSNGPTVGGIHALYASQRPIQQSDSASDMLDFQNIMSSSGGLSQLASQAMYYENLNPYQNYGNGGGGAAGGGVSSSGFPRQSSLEVLCALDGPPGPNSMENFGGLYKNDSFSWGKSGELSGLNGNNGGGNNSIDVNAINASYYSNSVGGGKMMVGPDGRLVDVSSGYYGGVGVPGASSLPYSSSAEWPSMNNLVVAAETIESLGSMNSLYGGGLVESMLQQQQQQQETFPFANPAQLHGHSGASGSSGHKPSPVASATAAGGFANASSQNSLQYDRASNHSRASRTSATPVPMSLLRDRSGSEGEAALSIAGLSGGGLNNAATASATGAAGDDDVGYPIDEDEGPATGGTNSVSNHSDSASSHSAPLQIDREALKAVDMLNVPLQQQEYTPITNMLRNNSYYIERLAALKATYGEQAAYEMLNTPEVSGKMSTLSRNTSSLSAPSDVPKNSSISDFWMLVGLGDLPQPDTDFVSSDVFPNGGGGGAGGVSEKSTRSDPSMTTENTSSSTTATTSASAAAAPSPLVVTSEYPTGVPAHKPPGSPRIAPDLLPPHLQRLAALKHTRPASSDSLTGGNGGGEGDSSKVNGTDFAFTAGSSQKQQKKRVKVDASDSEDDALIEAATA